MSEECPSENTMAIDQSKFWDSDGMHWEPHRIGWAVAGGCALLTVLISSFTISQHCRNYTNPAQQRQILRILYMPPVYAIISFFSYRFFRYYTYYSFISIAYEAITLSAFLSVSPFPRSAGVPSTNLGRISLLIIEYVAATTSGRKAEDALERKDKRPLPFPFCCWRFRPTKKYFMYTVKWSVLQYVIIRPAASIAGMICEKLGVLCHAAGYSPKYAAVYIESIVFISISIALYGLILFYELTKEELRGKKPMAKFLSIKLIVMFTFYQLFVFNALKGRVIHETEYWTETNIANGLNALAVCIEMVLFAVFMHWAYSANEYKGQSHSPKGSVGQALWDSINFSDLAREIGGSLGFYVRQAKKHDFASAFGLNKRNDTNEHLLTPRKGSTSSTVL